MPAAEPSVTEQTQTAGTDARSPAFFVQPRPIWHHVVLTVGTFGLYLYLWMYRVWRYFRVVEGRSVIPVLRSLFRELFIYALFRDLTRAAQRHGYPEAPPAGPLAIMYWALLLCGLLPLPAAFVQFLIVIPLLPAFEMANFIWRKEWPGMPERRGFSVLEAVVLGVGAFIWTQMIYLAIVHPELLPARPGAVTR